MLKFTVFLALFGTSLAFGWPFGGSSEERNGRGGRITPPMPEGPVFPFPTFLRDVNSTERRAWFDIEHNKNATKAEIKTLQDQWSANQTPEVQQKYNEYKQALADFIQNVTANADEIAANLTQDAQNIYNQIKEIRQNQDISRAEECTQIREVMSNVTREIRRELKAIRGLTGKCCHHKGRGGFGSGRHGPFGNGGFRAPRRAGSSEEFSGPGKSGGNKKHGGGPRRGNSNSGSNESGDRNGSGGRGNSDSDSNESSNSNSNEDSNSGSGEHGPCRPSPTGRPIPTGRPSPGPLPTGRPLPTGGPLPSDGPLPSGGPLPTDFPVVTDGNQFPTFPPSSTPRGFFSNFFG